MYKVKKKNIKDEYKFIIKIPYCGLQYILDSLTPFAYSEDVLGHVCDYYSVNDAVISTGRSPIGILPSREIIDKYNSLGKEISYSTDSVETKTDKLNSLAEDFVLNCLTCALIDKENKNG